MKIIPFGSNVIAKVLPSDGNEVARFAIVTLPRRLDDSDGLEVGMVIHAKQWTPTLTATSNFVVIERRDILCIIEQ